jgi:hypothetical protein
MLTQYRSRLATLTNVVNGMNRKQSLIVDATVISEATVIAQQRMNTVLDRDEEGTGHNMIQKIR